MLKTHSTKNFFNQVSRKAPLRTSPKLSRCRHGRRRAPVSLLVLLCKTSAKYFGTEAKILSQSLKAGHGSSPAALSCKNILVRSTWVECSCVQFSFKFHVQPQFQSPTFCLHVKDLFHEKLFNWVSRKAPPENQSKTFTLPPWTAAGSRFFASFAMRN